ncbi:MAG: rhomboid family intramembrane serine protease [bacterium]
MALCVGAQVLNIVTGGWANRALFSVYRASLLDPLTWVRCVGHVLGHADWNHLMNNMMYILILGPMLEEKYGSEDLMLVVLATAVVTGVVTMAFFPRVALLGASGVVFAFILLSSITATDGESIPVTFILVALIYLGQQVYEGVFVADNVSQLGHILGGAVGSALGFAMNRLLARNKR